MQLLKSKGFELCLWGKEQPRHIGGVLLDFEIGIDPWNCQSTCLQ